MKNKIEDLANYFLLFQEAKDRWEYLVDKVVESFQALHQKELKEQSQIQDKKSTKQTWNRLANFLQVV